MATLLGVLDRKDASEVLGSDIAGDVALAGELAEAALGTVDDLAEVIATAGGRGPGAVLLDEAHAMLGWPPGALSALNAVLRGELGVGVMLASSDTDARERLTRLIELTGGHPYLTMRLARDTARIASDPEQPRRAGGAELEAALYELRRDPVWTALHEAPHD